MFLQEVISPKVNDFNAVCKAHSVKYIYAFGSVVTDQFDKEKSDVDLLVEIDDPDPVSRGEKLMSLWDTFEAFFSRRVDMLTENSVHNPYLKKSINASKILIYDGARQKVLI